jgi:hypothetical protein
MVASQSSRNVQESNRAWYCSRQTEWQYVQNFSKHGFEIRFPGGGTTAPLSRRCVRAVCVECAWSVRGVCLECAWSVRGVCLECACSIHQLILRYPLAAASSTSPDPPQHDHIIRIRPAAVTVPKGSYTLGLRTSCNASPCGIH